MFHRSEFAVYLFIYFTFRQHLTSHVALGSSCATVACALMLAGGVMETPTAMTSQMRGTAVSAGDWWEHSVSADAREYVGVLPLKQVSFDPCCSPNFLFFFRSLSYIYVHS